MPDDICGLCSHAPHGSGPCAGPNCYCGHHGHWTVPHLEKMHMKSSAKSSPAPEQREYIVNVREVWVQPYKIRAISPEEAARLVREGKGSVMEDGLEYSHQLGPDTWTVDAGPADTGESK